MSTAMTTAITTPTVTHSSPSHTLPPSPRGTAMAALALAAVLTFAMLAGVDALATSDATAPQMAQAASRHA